MSQQAARKAEILAEDGIVVIEDYLEPQTCDDLYEEMSTAIEEREFDVVEGSSHSYAELRDWKGAVANKRTGRDDGMIDVFNVDQVVPEVADFKNDPEVNEIVNRASGTEFSPDNVNVYWNRSVTDTRGFHADSYNDQFKSFVYLTDVPNSSYGPFTYVKGSHDVSVLHRKISEYVN